MVPINITPNLSVHSGIPVRKLPRLEQWDGPPDIKGKLGVVLALTDGDNLYMQAEQYLKPAYWEHPRRVELKVASSLAPELYELAPGLMIYFYETRSSKDFLVALSGAGYTFPSAFRDRDSFRSVSLSYMKLSSLDVLWNLDPGFNLALTDTAVAGLIEHLGAREYIKGVLAGYAPPLSMRYYRVPEGYPPVLHSRSNYFITGKEELTGLIKADSLVLPDRGRIAFYSVNAWTISYGDLLEAKGGLEDRKNIIFPSPQKAFLALKNWREG